MQNTLFKTFVIGLCLSLASCTTQDASEQSEVSYTISFENAVHHEAEVAVTFSEVAPGKFAFRMSRTSPGRYALHEFAKNVYNVRATNSVGEPLTIERPDPYQWVVNEHDGTVNVRYTLFANRGGGTYSQIDETHAHLNIPATFMFAPTQATRPIKVHFNPRTDLGWKIATQLKKTAENTYTAPNLQYFMDSPTELSNHQVRSFEVASNAKNYTVNFVLHDSASPETFDAYFEKVKAVVLQEKAVFGELPDFDFGEYTFLACYVPNASGDGMEHRNSTILTSTRGLENGGERNIGTVSHEFFHAWNVERIRPKALEPFNFEEANMSGELWFAEGFTSYYTGLILCRAQVSSEEDYINGLMGTFNYVWNSPGTSYFNPIEMSYQAPFVDAARSVDPVNRANTFISYYSYGSVLGLALDLALRNEPGNLSLDDYMKAVWNAYGKKELPYTVANLHEVLNEYAGTRFGDAFFNDYIYHSKMPDYTTLFASVGIALEQKSTAAYFGPRVVNGRIVSDPLKGSPAYTAGLDLGDHIRSVNGKEVSENTSFDILLRNYKPGEVVELIYERHDTVYKTQLKFEKDPTYSSTPYEAIGMQTTTEMLNKRKAWLAKR